MLKVVYDPFYAECRYGKCHYAECRGAIGEGGGIAVQQTIQGRPTEWEDAVKVDLLIKIGCFVKKVLALLKAYYQPS
jgi:hypothetical protein